MSSRVFFPDNTVLINFAYIGRVALLGELIPSRQWCHTVSVECAKSSKYPHLSELTKAPAVFGSPLIPDRAERLDTETLRTAMAAPGDKRSDHRGEAETLAIIQRRGITAIFATDDVHAARHAISLGIPVVSTWKLLGIAHLAGKLTDAQAYADACTLEAHGRGWPKGTQRTREAFFEWLARDLR